MVGLGTVPTISYGLAGLGFVGGAVWLILALVRKTGARTPAILISAATAFAVAIFWVAGTSSDKDTYDETAEFTLPSMPFGWIKDMEFGDQLMSGTLADLSRYSLVFFGGKVVLGGYDPSIYIFSASSPGGSELGAIVDEELGRITANDPDQTLLAREAVRLSGEAGESVELSRRDSLRSQTVRTFQIYVVRDRRSWILQCVVTEGNSPIEIMKPNLPRFEMKRCKESLFSVRFR